MSQEHRDQRKSDSPKSHKSRHEQPKVWSHKTGDKNQPQKEKENLNQRFDNENEPVDDHIDRDMGS